MAADGRGTKSAAVRERAAMAMLTESSIGAAARRAGVGARTLRRWIGRRRRVLTGTRQGAPGGLRRRYRPGADFDGESRRYPPELLGERDQPNVRLGAARTLVELAAHRHDADVLTGRLADIERRLEERGR